MIELPTEDFPEKSMINKDWSYTMSRSFCRMWKPGEANWGDNESSAIQHSPTLHIIRCHCPT